ncbi:Fes1-domain-containing protein [Metschnikowia bicuspidata var. bicuspidata NRRL YB-4993]|uniref:Hsp70 nucleotide exchange factor FES1 n=1 Tax=Metschnikowia bicuspidata var. bicuspidata NRRL YB-4993 TaxID=869754 RepID=A0A1A0H4W4_9ASCO|nr:Fes1-domain-containing protein [Metschnikowia bicuspidata var. bicuspidata NRRL YB-4993]OBA19119.1 Fes1-domain-containing protein [Metschnikowia bicuspidata var. bicuspidata NRRL YB-4993]
MEKLLQWSIAQQTGDKETQEKIGQPDPKMLLQLFGGPDEPTLMKQSMMVASNPEATDEDKEIALENFEMLIENLDNANNIENMRLWPAVIDQLHSENQTFQVLSASIIAIATQNNTPSQVAFAKQERGLKKLIELASNSDTPKELHLKSTFALASLIRNNEDAASKFISSDGLACINLVSSLKDHKSLLRKLSLISAVLSTGSSAQRSEQVRSLDMPKCLIEILSPEYQTSCIDKALNVISQLKQFNFAFTDAELENLKVHMSTIQPLEDKLSQDDFISVRGIIA